MILEIKIPSPGESVTEVLLARWMVEDGVEVEADQDLAEIESEKATLTITSPESGTISILLKPGTTVTVGAIACKIDTAKTTGQKKSPEKKVIEPSQTREDASEAIKPTPLAKKRMEELGMSVEDVMAGLHKISRDDVDLAAAALASDQKTERNDEHFPMSPLRKKLAERLVSVRNQTAMLTTFNEVDLSQIRDIRHKFQDAFQKKHGVKLGYMSFFSRAVCIALRSFPVINSRIENDEIIEPHYIDLGIAVQSEKGLMVPVIRDAGMKDIASLEKTIAELADKARKLKLSMDDMAGGTFTITNGGVYGSLMSTPILNPPQTGILGMHNIVDRPVAVNGKVEIRPMMYIALSYDHRLIDGKDSVLFLKTIRDLLEEPLALIGNSGSPYNQLLNI